MRFTSNKRFIDLIKWDFESRVIYQWARSRFKTVQDLYNYSKARWNLDPRTLDKYLAGQRIPGSKGTLSLYRMAQDTGLTMEQLVEFFLKQNNLLNQEQLKKLEEARSGEVGEKKIVEVGGGDSEGDDLRARKVRPLSGVPLSDLPESAPEIEPDGKEAFGPTREPWTKRRRSHDPED